MKIGRFFICKAITAADCGRKKFLLFLSEIEDLF